MPMNHILLVDDEENVLKSLTRLFNRHLDCHLETYASGREALAACREMDFDLVISDYRMPEMDGVALLSEIKVLQPETMRIILSGYTDLEALLGAINRAEIYRFVTKPWNDYDLVATIQDALRFQALQKENHRLAEQVRAQERELDQRRKAIDELQAKHPQLFEVNWTADGAIRLNEDET